MTLVSFEICQSMHRIFTITTGVILTPILTNAHTPVLNRLLAFRLKEAGKIIIRNCLVGGCSLNLMDQISIESCVYKIYNFLFWVQDNTLDLHIIIHVKNLGLINLMTQIKWSHHIFVPICHADQNSGTLWYYQKNKYAKEEFWSPLRSELRKAFGEKDVKKYVVVTC